ncbi:response regulator [Bradyrhizobium algeriense]|uniref:response regulator n=1 Tax=Bradyrhizobium algeriense TaxID=634784 RepID=UPI00167C85E4|nr:response regulator [Bradyrhizobium algeriense]
MNRSYKIRCITIVDNDLNLIQSMNEYLRNNNVCTALAGTHAEALTRYNNAEVILVNMDLVRDNGFDLVRDLRDRGDVPIIVVGSRRGAIANFW